MRIPFLTQVIERIRARKRLALVLGTIGLVVGSAAISTILYLLTVMIGEGTGRNPFGLYGWFTLASIGLAVLAASCILTQIWPRRITWYGLVGAAVWLLIASLAR